MSISEQLIARAIELVVPFFEAICAEKNAVWGPKFVKIWVGYPGLGATCFTMGEEKPWQAQWGDEPDFVLIAKKKLDLARSYGMDTATIRNAPSQPLRLGDGVYAWAGGITRSGISIGCSGLKQWADHAIAETVATTIIMMAKLQDGE